MSGSRPEVAVARSPQRQRTCTCCGSTRLAVQGAYACRDPLFAARVHPTLDVLRCEACGLSQVDHAHLDVREFVEWTARDAERSRGQRSRSALRWLEARGRALAELSRRFHDGGPVRRIFQLNAGPGLDLVALQRVHRNAECWADRLDPDGQWRSLAQIGSLAAGPFDRVVMTHVLGHVPDPTPFVRRVVAHLRPGGLLIVEVGNDIEGALERRAALEPQLTFFTIRTLRKLFATNLGEELEEVHAATAGPRPGEAEAELEAREAGFLARLFGRAPDVAVDLSDDVGSEDRAFARVVLRRRSVRAEGGE